MKKPSRKQQFIASIERKILSGEWKVGDRLPTERELVTMFGASRTVVNASLSELAQKGFIKINPRQWTEVSDYDRDGKLDVLYSKMAYNGDGMDFDMLQGVLDTRRLIEMESVRLAAVRRTQDDINDLLEICQKERDCTELEERVELDYSFHHTLAVASKNPVYPLIINSFAPFARKYFVVFYERLQDKRLEKKHQQIVDAIIKKDAATAADILDKLLTHGEQVLKESGGNLDD